MVVVLPSVGVSVWFELHTVVFFSWMDGWMVYRLQVSLLMVQCLHVPHL